MLISFPLLLLQRQMLGPLKELPKWNSILQSFFLPNYPAQFLKDRWIVSLPWEKTFSNSVTLLDWPRGPSKASPPLPHFAFHFLTHHLCSSHLTYSHSPNQLMTSHFHATLSSLEFLLHLLKTYPHFQTAHMPSISQSFSWTPASNTIPSNSKVL